MGKEKGSDSMQHRILSFGEILWDIIGDKEYIGGAPFNLAAHLAQLGCRSFLVSRVGRDERGRDAIKILREIGVEDSYIQWDDLHPTGLVEVTLAMGMPAYEIRESVAYDFIQFDPKLEELKGEEFDVFCFGTLAQRSKVSRETLGRILKSLKVKHVFLDINLRKHHYSPEIIKSSLTFCTILKLNDLEVEEISRLLYRGGMDEKEFIARITDEYSISTACVTRGEKGCTIYHGGAFRDIPGIKTAVADTVGAGDAFSAGFLYQFCKNGDPFESGEVGNYLGAYVASRSGAVPAYSDEVKGFLGVK